MYYYSNFHNKNVSILFFHLPLITHYLAYSKWKVIFFTSPHGTITVILPTHKHYTHKKENSKSLISLRKSPENFQHQENILFCDVTLKTEMHLTQDLKIKETLTALKWKGKRLNANKGAKIIFNVSCQIVN